MTRNGEANGYELLMDAQAGRKPKTVARLADWEYVEKSLHRLICGWGSFPTCPRDTFFVMKARPAVFPSSHEPH